MKNEKPTTPAPPIIMLTGYRPGSDEVKDLGEFWELREARFAAWAMARASAVRHVVEYHDAATGELKLYPYDGTREEVAGHDEEG